MKAILALLTVIGLPIVALNWVGGIVSGVWLAILGEWGVIALGLLGMWLTRFILSIALLPNVALGAFAAALLRRGAGLAAMGVMLLINVWTTAVICVWCLWVLGIFLPRADARSFIPVLIWSYGAAVGPWVSMAAKEARDGGGDASVIASFFACLAYLVCMLIIAFSPASITTAVIAFVAIMVVQLAVQVPFGFVAIRDRVGMYV